MSAIDNLLSKSLEDMIKKKLGKKTFQKIEKRLMERYNLSVLQSIRDFQTMDATLREFFGPSADLMEMDFLKDFITLDKSKRNNSWIVIEDQNLSRLILESFGDPDKKMILDTSLAQPNVILNILNNCKIAKSSGYRITNELIKDGLLTSKGFTTTRDGKKITKYTSLFENIKIDIQGPDRKVVVKVQVNEEFLRESYLMKVMQNQ